jgi:hypothetical protein
MRRVSSLVVVAAAWFVVGSAAAPVVRFHDARYCEVIGIHGTPPAATATVWNTIGLNRCPASKWNRLDPHTLANQLGDIGVVLNGPRHFLMDSASGAVGPVVRIGGIRMRRVARIHIHSFAELARAPYENRVISRSNTWVWHAGRRVFELVSPSGARYVMQSYAQIVDRRLTLAQLPRLGRRLHLPAGWRYVTRTLAHPLVLRAQGSATVIQDDLQNTYQLLPRGQA